MQKKAAAKTKKIPELLKKLLDFPRTEFISHVASLT